MNKNVGTTMKWS